MKKKLRILVLLMAVIASLTQTAIAEELTEEEFNEQASSFVKQAEYNTSLHAPFTKGQSSVNEQIDPETGNLRFDVTLFDLKVSEQLSMNATLVYDLSFSKEQQEYVNSSYTNILRDFTKAELTLYNVGLGFKWQLPYVEVFDEYRKTKEYVHLENGGVYLADSSVQSGLDKYELSDLRFTKNTDTSEYRYNLRYKDGSGYEFSKDGLPLKKFDRFGNAVYYGWNTDGEYPKLTRISDTNGRIISITYNNNVTTVEYADKKYLLVTTPVSEDIPLGLLREIVEPDGSSTTFSYGEEELSFTFKSSKTAKKNIYHPIEAVTYSTGARSEYEYCKGTKNLDSTGRMEYLKLASKLDIDYSGEKRSSVRYTYSGEPDGYPTYKADELPDTYVYHTLETDSSGVRRVYRYNSKHLLVSRTEYYDGVLLTEQLNSYDRITLYPTGNRLVTYNQSGESITVYTDTKYDKYANLLFASTYADTSEREVNSVRYTYDLRYSILLRQTCYLNADTTVEAVNTLTQDKRNIRTSCVYENGKLKSKADFTYNRNGSVNKTSTLVDENRALVTEYEYADRRNSVSPTKVTYRNISSAYGKAEDISVSYEYDVYGNTIKSIDANGNVTVHKYDSLDRITKTTLPNGGISEYTYDIKANTITEALPEGGRMYYDYDGFGGLILVRDLVNGDELTRITYLPTGNIGSETDGNGNTASYEYDCFDRITGITVTDKDQSTVLTRSITYNDAYMYGGIPGTKITVIDTDGKSSYTTEYVYDYLGRTVCESIVGDNENRTVTYEYDILGNKTKVTYPTGRSEEYECDCAGNVISARNGDICEYMTYDYAGNLTSHTDGEGRVTYTEYDTLGRQIRVITPYDGITSAVTTYEYDKNGNLIRTTDPEGNVSTSEYNAVNLVTKAVAGESISEYVYDREGRLTKAVYGSDHVNKYEYDTRGRLINSTDSLGFVEKYTYDAMSNLITYIDRNGEILYHQYDSFGRLLSKTASKSGDKLTFTYDVIGNVTRSTSNGEISKYEYNSLGELVKAYGSSSVIDYAYNADGNVSSMSLSLGGAHAFSQGYAYDTYGRLNSVTTPAGRTSYTYDKSGRLTSEYTDASGVSSIYSYYPSGNISNITQRFGTDVCDILTYEYDRSGRKTLESDSRGTKEYFYDSTNRLAQVVEDNVRVTSYTYDKYGNISAEYTGDKEKLYAYDKNNRLVSEYDNGKVTGYSYDNNGNRIKSISTSGSTYYTYDSFGRMTKVSSGNGSLKASYTYDANGIRTSKTVNGNVREIINSGSNVIAEYTENGSMYYYRGLSLIGYTDTTKNTYSYLKNAHGDITGTVNASGRVSASFDYDAYGNKLTSQVNPTPFGYSGEYCDAETGMIYLRARYYDPSTSRFISEDPIRDGVNWYAYCAGDPVNFVDPSGTDAIVLTNEYAVNIYDNLYDGLKPLLPFTKSLYFGHQGILVQDENDTWYYFSCGINYVEYTKVSEEFMTDLKTFSDKYYNKGNGDYVYTTSTYIKGDFTDSCDFYQNYYEENKKDGNASSYDARSNNCTIVMTKGLYKGKLNDGTNISKYMNYERNTIPNSYKKSISDAFYNNSFTYDEYEQTIREKLNKAKVFSWLIPNKIGRLESLLAQKESNNE